jgi:hypothetical protein
MSFTRLQHPPFDIFFPFGFRLNDVWMFIVAPTIGVLSGAYLSFELSESFQVTLLTDLCFVFLIFLQSIGATLSSCIS